MSGSFILCESVEGYWKEGGKKDVKAQSRISLFSLRIFDIDIFTEVFVIPDEQIDLFKSDFWSLIDWIKLRDNPVYEVSYRIIEHSEDFRKLFYSFTDHSKKNSLAFLIIDPFILISWYFGKRKLCFLLPACRPGFGNFYN